MSETKPSPKPQATASAVAEPSLPKRKRILLVEGDNFTRLVVLLQLRLAGFAVDFTSSGSIALAKVRSGRPDALLVELKLVGLSGLELIKAARAEPSFGNRPVYVYTRGDHIKRASNRELARLGATLFDKNVVSREEVVQALEDGFRAKRKQEQSTASAGAAAPAEVPSEAVPPEAIEGIVAGVRDEAQRLAKRGETGAQAATGNELLSRVRSLAHCAKAAGLPNLEREAKVLESFVNQLCKDKQGCTTEALSTVTRSVEIMGGMCSKATAKEQSLSQFSAVIVDEEPASNRALKQALHNAGFAPACFEDAADARKHLVSNRTDLIVVNLPFPDGHGLNLRELRQLPKHAETPVVFGPSTDVAPAGKRLKGSTRGLESEPLLLTELVLKALNEVQRTGKSAQAAESKSPVAGGGKQPVAKPAAAASQPYEDYVELFARPAGRQAGAAADSSAQTAFVSAAAIQQPVQRSSESLPEDNTATFFIKPSVQAQPAMAGVDHTAEFLASLPVTSIDNTTMDERPVEELPPTALEAEVTGPAQAEPTVEDGTAAAPWLTAATGVSDRLVPSADTPSQSQPDDHGPVQESAINEEVMNHQVQSVAEEYSQEGEVSQPQTAEARCAELERQLASFRQAFANYGGAGDPHQHERVQELEQRLSQAATELEKQREEQQRAEAELRRELEFASTASRERDTARQQAEARCAQLEQELGGLRQAEKELAEKLSQAQKASEQPGAAAKPLDAQSPAGEGEPVVPASELEVQVRQGVAALARATAELAKERGERQRSEQRTAELNERLQALHEELRRTLQSEREGLARVGSLEEQQRQTSQALDERTADLEQEQAERLLAQEHLEKAKEVTAQLRKDLAFYEEVNKKFGGSREELQARLGASLGTVREHEARLQQDNAERRRLEQKFEDSQHELQEALRKLETLEQELQSTRSALQICEVKLQKENAERLRLSEALDSVQLNSHNGSERDLEFSKLQSALEAEQVERKRQETELAHLRHRAWDAAHSTRALRTTLRRQIRGPLDGLVNSTRSLLELEMDDAQKKLAEAVLQDALLVQTRLRDPELAHEEPAEAATPATSTPA